MEERGEIDVAHVARLARLNLTEEETELFKAQLGRILEYAAQLKQADTSSAETDAATISEMLVRSGQRVHKGQLLARLASPENTSQLGQLEAETQSLQARSSRLTSEGTGQTVACAGADCRFQHRPVQQHVWTPCAVVAQR